MEATVGKSQSVRGHFTNSIWVWGSWDSSPHPHQFRECRLPTTRTASEDSPAMGDSSPREIRKCRGLGLRASHVTTYLLFLALLKVCNSSISPFAQLLFAFPNVSFLRAAAYLCLKVDSPAPGRIPWFTVDTRKGPVSSDLENKLVGGGTGGGAGQRKGIRRY